MNPGQKDKRNFSNCSNLTKSETWELPYTWCRWVIWEVLPSLPFLSGLCQQSSNWSASMPHPFPAPARRTCLDITFDLPRILMENSLLQDNIQMSFSDTWGLCTACFQPLHPASQFCKNSRGLWTCYHSPGIVQNVHDLIYSRNKLGR